LKMSDKRWRRSWAGWPDEFVKKIAHLLSNLIHNVTVETSNPTTSSYNARVVKIYCSSNSMARFYDKNFSSDVKTL
jgi:hypothetical protein